MNFDGNSEVITDLAKLSPARHPGTATDIIVSRDPVLGPIWNFNGSTSKITTPNTGLTSTIQSWECWIKTSTDYSAKKGIIAQNQLTTGLRGFRFHIATTNQVVAEADYAAVGAAIVGPVINDGRWHHLFAAFNNTASAVSFYVDGTFIGSGNNSSGAVSGATFNLGIGQDTTNYVPFTGQIAYFRIWSVTAPQSAPLTTNQAFGFQAHDLVKQLYREPYGMFLDAQPSRRSFAFIAPSFAVVTGSAGLTGLGSSTVAGVVTRYGAAAFTSVGTLAAAGAHTAYASSALVGNGTLSSSGVRTRFGASSLTGTGSSATTGVRTRYGASALTGVGSSTVSGALAYYSAANLTGLGSLAANGLSSVIGAAALTGSGTLTSNGTRIRFGVVALTGSGTSSTVGYQIAHGVCTLTGSGTSTTSGVRYTFASAALTGLGSLNASGAHTAYSAAALQGTGSLTSNGTRIRFGFADLTGTGSETVSGSLAILGVATLTGLGTLTAAGLHIATGAASLTGNGTLTSNGTRTRFGVCNTTGTGTLACTGYQIATGVANLADAGSSTILGTRITYSSTIILTGIGSMTATGFVALIAELSGICYKVTYATFEDRVWDSNHFRLWGVLFEGSAITANLKGRGAYGDLVAPRN